MKKHSPALLVILIIAALAGCAIPYESAHGATVKDSSPVGDLSHVSKADIIATIQHMQRNEHDALSKLGQAQVALASSQAETKAVQVAADKLKDDRDRLLEENQQLVDGIRKKDAEIAKKDHKLDLLGWALATLAAYAVFQLSGSLAGVLSAAIPQLLAGRLIAAALAFAAVFAWVRYL